VFDKNNLTYLGKLKDSRAYFNTEKYSNKITFGNGKNILNLTISLRMIDWLIDYFS